MKRRGCFSSFSFGLVLAAGFVNAALAVAATPSPTTTKLAIEPGNSVAVGTRVTLTASVSSSGGPVSPGLVLFCNPEAVRCKDLDILGQAQLTAAGTASLNLILPIGTHQIKAEFQGTKSNASSWSSAESLTVTGKYPTATTMTAVPSPATVAIRGYVSSIGSPATGKLNFIDSANPLLPLATLTVGSPTLTFDAVGPTASFIGVVADFNRDGRLDQLAYGPDFSTVVYFGNGDGTFSLGPANPTPITDPGTIAVGDFNNDDIPDLAVENIDTGTVSIFLGKGDGTLTAGGSFSPPVANSLSVGDLNNDGNADLILSSSVVTTIWLGDGKGGFTMAPPSTQPLPTSEAFAPPVIVTDLNGDRKADLVFNVGNYIDVRLGNGDGTFVEAPAGVPMRFVGNCTGVVVADFNGDGKPDLAVADSGDPELPGGVFLLLGNGNGTFGSPDFAPAYIGGEFPESLALGDFNGDGKVDLAEDDGYQQVETFMGNGDGTFVNGSSFYSNTSYDSIFAADFNNDGLSDLFLSFTNAISLAEWRPSVALGGLTLTGSLGIHNVSVSYEGDALHDPSVSASTALQGPKAATAVALAASPTPIAPGQAMQLVATISPSVAGGDKPAGTVTFSNGPNALSVVPVSNGSAAFSTTTLPIGTNISLTAFYSGNSEFDSSISLPVHLTTGGTLRPTSTTELSVSPSPSTPQGSVVTLRAKVLDGGSPLPTGLVIFYEATSVHPGETVVGQAQLTSSGVATMKFRPPPGSLAFKAVYQGTNTHAGSESAPQSLRVTANIATSTAISVNPPTYTADVTAYGLLAATGGVSFADATDSNLVFATAPLIPLNRLLTELSLTQASSSYAGPTPEAVALADLNGDGILDIAAITGPNELLIQLGNPDGTFTNRSTISLTGTGYAMAIAVADYNSDGIPDLAVLQSGAGVLGSIGSVEILLGHGNGTFINKSTQTVGPFAATLVAGDFNGDGAPDLLTTNTDGTATVLIGAGDGTFSAASSPGLGALPVGPAIVADFNGDGIPDVATAVVKYANGFTVLLGNGDGTFVTYSPGVGGCQNAGGLGSVTEADFNGDGIPDILWMGCSGKLTMLLGNGNATFSPWAVYDVPGSYTSAAATDLNGDGIPDLIVTGRGSEGGLSVATVLGRGDGTFAVGPTASIPGLFYDAWEAVGDFNGDGIPDILVEGRFTIDEFFSAITQVSQATAPDAALPGSGTQQAFATYAGDANHIGSVSATVPAAHTNRR